MKYVVLVWTVLLLGAGIYVFNYMPKPVEELAPADVNEKSWRRGRAMYRANCTSCHNSNPDLPGSVGPKLRGIPEQLLVDRLTNGKGAMPAFPNMKRFQKDIYEYLK